MNKFTSVLMLSCALALSACGGDSDSSGSSGSYDPTVGLDSCAIRYNIITVSAFDVRACSVTKPDINNGKRFGLSCKNRENSEGELMSLFSITSAAGGNKETVKNDIESYPLDKYIYICDSSVPSTGL